MKRRSLTSIQRVGTLLLLGLFVFHAYGTVESTHKEESNLRERVGRFFKANKPTAQRLGKKIMGHLAAHSVLYALGLQYAYYNVGPNPAFYDVYEEKEYDPEDDGDRLMRQSFNRLCMRLNLDPEKIRLMRIKKVKGHVPFFVPRGHGAAHVVGTRGIVYNSALLSRETIAHELTHIKNKHAYIIMAGAFLSPIVVDAICVGLGKAFDRYNGNNKTLKRMFSVGKSIVQSFVFRGIASFICALKILHACEHNADVSYAKELGFSSGNLHCGSGKGAENPYLVIPILNINLGHLWHPPY